MHARDERRQRLWLAQCPDAAEADVRRDGRQLDDVEGRLLVGVGGAKRGDDMAAQPGRCDLPAGYSGRILVGMNPVDAEPGATDGLCRLLEMFSADLPLQDLVSEPQRWDGARLERVDADTRCIGRTVVWAMVFDGSGTPVAASAFSRDPADSPDVAVQMMTVVHREHRGRGLARAVKNVLLGAARDRGIRRIHTATATGSRRIRALNAEYGADPRARDVYWQKRLEARES